MLVLLWQFSLAKENCKWGDCNSFSWGIIQNELHTSERISACLHMNFYLFVIICVKNMTRET